MKEDIFRKKSLEKIKSPEDLNTYLSVTNPSVWLIIGAVILLLGGLVVWSFFGRIETKINLTFNVQDNHAQTKISENDLKKLLNADQDYLSVTIYDNSFSNIEINEELLIVSVDLSSSSVPNGTYNGVVLIESIKPVDLMFK